MDPEPADHDPAAVPPIANDRDPTPTAPSAADDPEFAPGRSKRVAAASGGLATFSIGSAMAFIGAIAIVLFAWRIHPAIGAVATLAASVATVRTMRVAASRDVPMTLAEKCATFSRTFGFVLIVVVVIPASAVIGFMGTCIAIASAGGPRAINAGVVLGAIAGFAAPGLIILALFRFAGKTRLRGGSPSGKGIEWIDRRPNS